MLSYIETGFCNNQVEFINPLQTLRDASRINAIVPIEISFRSPVYPFRVSFHPFRGYTPQVTFLCWYNHLHHQPRTFCEHGNEVYGDLNADLQ